MYGIIYKATGPTGLVYIGQTKNTLKRRKKGHIYRARKGDKYPFQIALLEFGVSAFTWDQIDTAETKEELDAKEKQWIAHYQSDNPAHGYNGTDGGINGTVSVEARQKMSLARKGKTFTAEHRRKIGEARKGKPLSLETRRKISEAHKGKTYSDEYIEKQRAAQKGRKKSEEWRRKIGAAHKGRQRSPEYRQKISEGLKRYFKEKGNKRK